MATKKTNKTTAAKATTKKAPAAKKSTATKKAATPATKAAEDTLFPCECETKETKPVAEKAIRVTFSVRAEVGSKVFVAGSFNDWDPTAKRLQDKNGSGLFTCSMNLKKGKYQYKFVINGTWCADPECADWVQNDMGTLNSVKVVE